MRELQRLTTEYVEAEDRIRISGELASGETVVMWLSQRLLTRLLPHLFLWLEKQSGASIPVDIAQSFAQEAATANLTQELPVDLHPGSDEWLVVAVDINPNQDVLNLGFRADGKKPATISLNPIALRQWLSILQNLWYLAEWHAEIWPEWMLEKANQAEKNHNLKLH